MLFKSYVSVSGGERCHARCASALCQVAVLPYCTASRTSTRAGRNTFRSARADANAPGVTAAFPLPGSRSLYGGYTKLAAELLIEEYKAMYGARAVVNRCGVIGVHLYGGAKGC